MKEEKKKYSLRLQQLSEEMMEDYKEIFFFLVKKRTEIYDLYCEYILDREIEKELRSIKKNEFINDYQDDFIRAYIKTEHFPYYQMGDSGFYLIKSIINKASDENINKKILYDQMLEELKNEGKRKRI